jgi:hypothetical protein
MTTRLALRLVFAALGLTFWAFVHFYARPGQSAASQTDAARLNPGPAFEGDMFATMPRDWTRPSTVAEDQERAKGAVTWVRVIFETNSQPQFAALVKSALQREWNTNLGYQLVFGESRGPLEAAATAVTYRISVQPSARSYVSTLEPNRQLLFCSVNLTVQSSLSAKIQNWFPRHVGYAWSNPVPTSWDGLGFSCDAPPLPRDFSYRPEDVDGLNRRQLYSLYHDFGLKLHQIPAFCFFPNPELARIRDLYTWPNQNGTNPPVDPREFDEVARGLLGNYKFAPCIDAICIHLLDSGATNYLAGITTVVGSWSPGMSAEHRQVLTTYESFANYRLMKTLLGRQNSFVFIDDMPEVWNDPVLGYWLRGYIRRNADSPQLSWMASHYADKLKTVPVFSRPQAVDNRPKPKPVIIIGSPPSAFSRTNHIASLN